jgi:hypothetical protein
MLGSAFPASRLLLVEQPGPWGRAGLLDSRFDRAVAHRLVARLSRQGIRVLAIRRPGRAVADGPRKWAVVDCRPGREAVRWGDFAQDDELLRLDVTALLDNRSAAADFTPHAASTVPLYAVCAHGTHDVCCAINGRPVAAVLETLRPGQVWECSHVGGDRFAANVLVLPSGLLYGRVDVADAGPLLSATELGEVLERNARGRVGFSSDVQTAMIFAHRQRPGLRIAEVRPIDSHRVSPALTSVRLAVGEEFVDIQVEVQSSPTAWLTCQAGQPSAATVYRALTMDVVSTTR